MMGVCFECLVEVDGQANCQACLLPVRAGMRVLRQRGARDFLVVDPGEDSADE
jgi:predicted molibdopterin-dependent oxidoreductase YjgC